MSFISYLINGISLGSVYAIIALGYTMVYGIAKMLNFAHGDVIMVGGFAVFTIVSTYGLPPALGILVAVVICTVLGIVIERVAYKPLRNAASPLAVLITAIGVSYLLQNVALLIFGANTKSFTSVVSIPPLKLAEGKLMISGETIVTIISGIIVMICLTLFVNKTKAGQAMLAVSEDKGAAHGNQCERNHSLDVCHRIGFGGSGRRAALLVISFPDSLYRRHAWNQGFCGCGVRWDRFHTGSHDRGHSAGDYRDSGKSLYFFSDGGCHCFCGFDCGSSC